MSWVSDCYREHKQKWLNFQPFELDPMLIRQRLGALSPETEWPNPHLAPVVAKRVRASAKRSAVAIILRDQPELPIVLTQRSAKIRFGGQWCFPGGRGPGSDDGLPRPRPPLSADQCRPHDCEARFLAAPAGVSTSGVPAGGDEDGAALLYELLDDGRLFGCVGTARAVHLRGRRRRAPAEHRRGAPASAPSCRTAHARHPWALVTRWMQAEAAAAIGRGQTVHQGAR